MLTLVAGEARGTSGASETERWRLDHWPVFECSPPPDDAMLYVVPVSSGDQGFNLRGGNFWVAYLINTSWIVDLASGFVSTTATAEVDMEGDLWLTLAGGTSVHPTSYQGEQSTTRDLKFGEHPYFDQIVHIYVDGERSGITMDSFPGWYYPASLCLSLVRDDRLLGAAWFELDGTSWEHDFPAPMYLVFQSWSGFSSWVDEDVDHAYTEYDNSIRVMSYLFTSYTGTTEEEIWSLPTSEDTGA